MGRPRQGLGFRGGVGAMTTRRRLVVLAAILFAAAFLMLMTGSLDGPAGEVPTL